MASKTDWNAEQYLKFERERTRPSRDLLAQIPIATPRHIIDLGCGPGNSTAVLRQKYPDADIKGIDSSATMIQQARKQYPGLTNFEVRDISELTLDLANGACNGRSTPDLIFSNSVYHWLKHEERINIFKSLMGAQPSGGVFAFSVPIGLNTEPVQVLMRTTAVDPHAPWAQTLADVDPWREGFQSAQELYDALGPLTSDIHIWTTTYHQILDGGHEAVVEWSKSTGLRPYLDPLPEDQKEAFVQAYLVKIRAEPDAFPLMYNGKVCLSFPRLFLVAVRR